MSADFAPSGADHTAEGCAAKGVSEGEASARRRERRPNCAGCLDRPPCGCAGEGEARQTVEADAAVDGAAGRPVSVDRPGRWWGGRPVGWSGGRTVGRKVGRRPDGLPVGAAISREAGRARKWAHLDDAPRGVSCSQGGRADGRSAGRVVERPGGGRALSCGASRRSDRSIEELAGRGYGLARLHPMGLACRRSMSGAVMGSTSQCGERADLRPRKSPVPGRRCLVHHEGILFGHTGPHLGRTRSQTREARKNIAVDLNTGDVTLCRAVSACVWGVCSGCALDSESVGICSA